METEGRELTDDETVSECKYILDIVDQSGRDKVEVGVIKNACRYILRQAKEMKYSPFSVPLDGLYKAFVRFQADGLGGSCGDWEVEKEIFRSSTQWIAFYKKKAVAECVLDPKGTFYIKRLMNITDGNYKAFFDIAKSVFPDCLMSTEDRGIILLNSQLNVR